MQPPRQYSVQEDIQRPFDDRVGPKLDVFLDGARASRVISFDADEGWIDRYETDADGKIVVARESAGVSAKIERLFGTVDVRWREGVHA